MDYKPSRITGLVAVSGVIDLSRLEVIEYDEAQNVAANSLTTVLTYSASALANSNIVLIKCSGQDTAKWFLYIDTVLKGTIRSGGGDRNAEWSFPFPLALDAGQILDVKVKHFHTGDLLNFEAGLYAFESAP